MPCPSARVCGEPGARGGSARRGTEPSGDRSRSGDSGSVRDRIEGLGLRAPLTHDGKEAEKQERRQVASVGVPTAAAGAAEGVARVPWARGGPGSRLESGPAGHRLGPTVGGAGPRPQFRAGAEGLRGGRVPSRDSVPLPLLARPGRRGVRPEERGSRLGFEAPRGRARGAGGGSASVARRLGVVFVALLLLGVRKSSFYVFVPLNYWRERELGSAVSPARCSHPRSRSGALELPGGA